MSWDAILMGLPKGLSMDELSKSYPADWKPPAIGSSGDVLAQFQRLFPGLDHLEGQTCVTSDDFWIEFNYRVDKVSGCIDSIGIRSNAGPGAMAVMQRVSEAFDVRMVDCQSGQFADFSDSTNDSMRQFTDWRDRVLDRPS